MVPEDLLRIRFVSDPQLSPDGRRVAFVVTTLSEARDEYLSTIWMVDADGGEARPFTGGRGATPRPRWSPDGRWLAFVSERERKGKGQLYVMPADGGEPVRLTDLRPGVRAPPGPRTGRGSPSSRGSAAGRSRRTRRSASARSRRGSSTCSSTSRTAWASSTTGREQVFVVSADGGPARQLTAGAFDNHHPAWAPDGRDWPSCPPATPSATRTARPTSARCPSGRRVRGGSRATEGPVSWPAFSPDGRTVAYLGHAHARAVSRHHRVYTVPADGGAPSCLTETLDRNCEPMMGAAGPQWLGRTGALLFQVEDEGDVPLYRVAAAAAAPRSGSSAAPAR